jgi:hypothetical protein
MESDSCITPFVQLPPNRSHLHLSIRMQNFFKIEMTLRLNNQLLTSFTLLHFPNTNYKNKQKLAEPRFLFRGLKIKL